MEFHSELDSDDELFLIDDSIFESIIEEKKRMEDENMKRKRSSSYQDSDDEPEILFTNVKINVSKNKKKHNEMPSSGKKLSRSSVGLITNFFTPRKKSNLILAKADGNNIIPDPVNNSKKHSRPIFASSEDQKNKIEMKTNITFNSPTYSKQCELEKKIPDINKSDSKFNDFEHQTVENISIDTKHDNSIYYYQSLKIIVQEELENQLKLELQSEKQDRKFEKLFSTEEYDYFDKLLKLPKDARHLFCRMLCRKHGWHRISAIKYSGISENIEEVFMTLNKHGFVDLNIEKEKLEFLLEMLNKTEVLSLGKKFAKSTAKNEQQKENVIAAILKSCKTQPSALAMWSKSYESREKLLKTEALKLLGNCIILNSSALVAFNNLLILFAMTHSPIDEIEWSNEIHMMTNFIFKHIQYPEYKVNPIVIFETRHDFVSFVEAIKLMIQYNNVSSAEIQTEIADKVKKLLQDLLVDEKFNRRFSTLPSFLKKYSSGSVYSRILTQYCEQNKKKKNAKDIIKILKILINQDSFSVSKKGDWYNDLIKAYESIGKTDKAVTVLAKALEDKYINEVHKLVLQRRGMAILKKKKNNLQKSTIGDTLNSLCRVLEPEITEIKAKVVEGNEPGRKCTYVEESADGKLYYSVEERAIIYYKENGFTEGIHAEGSIIVCIYFLLFFDIIYGPGPPGAFQNSFQSQPLDFNSKCFYLNRQNAIDSRLEKIKNWSIDEFKEAIDNAYSQNYKEKNYKLICPINWREDFTVELFCDIVKCLGMKELSQICRRLVTCLRVYRSGFPDLTLWNTKTQKLKFVEVKSPNDKLSEKQRLWLDFLRQLNIPCEVCCVRNVASKAVKNANDLNTDAV